MSHTRTAPFNSWDAIKIIALLFMFVDHIGDYLFPDQLWLRAIGRGAAPIFLFLAGYAASYRFKSNLFWLGLVLVISNALQGYYFRPLNILFAILLWRAGFDWLERRGKRIERPWEWFVVAIVFLPMTIDLVTYGTEGWLFAISGYLKRRSQVYSRTLQRNFMIATFIFHAVVQIALFYFHLPEAALAVAVLSGVYILLWRLDIRDIDMSACPPRLVQLLKLMSYYSGAIYVIHLLILSWISHMPI